MADAPPPLPREPAPPAPPVPPIPAQELKRALKAFKKRIEIMRLERESRQIAGPLSKGAHSGIVAIAPPRQFPQQAWDELVKQGRLKYLGDGMYQLPQ